MTLLLTPPATQYTEPAYRPDRVYPPGQTRYVDLDASPYRDVALSGLAGAGKDTAAACLVKHHGYTAVKFADGLRACLLALNPLIGPNGLRLAEQVERQGWEQAKRWVPEVRGLMQRMGTEVGRELFGVDVWVEAAARRRAAISGPVVWTDVRFPNEVQWVTGYGTLGDGLRCCGGLWVHIERPDSTGLLDESNAAHASENALPPTVEADAVVVNDSTIAGLWSRLERALGLPAGGAS